MKILRNRVKFYLVVFLMKNIRENLFDLFMDLEMENLKKSENAFISDVMSKIAAFSDNY